MFAQGRVVLVRDPIVALAGGVLSPTPSKMIEWEDTGGAPWAGAQTSPRRGKGTADGYAMHVTVTWRQESASADQGRRSTRFLEPCVIRGEVCDTAHIAPSYS